MRPDVRIIQDQSIETREIDVTSSEAAALLAKYGYSNQIQTHTHTPIQEPMGETFEEMILRQQRESTPQPRNGPNSITFDSRNIGHASEEYRELDTGFGMKVTIVSDMKF